jgi:hypothetical protein
MALKSATPRPPYFVTLLTKSPLFVSIIALQAFVVLAAIRDNISWFER